MADSVPAAPQQRPSHKVVLLPSCLHRTLRVGSAKNASCSGKTSTSTRGRKLLMPEMPEVLRPHCEKCSGGEALRPGLDCRCHCSQCAAAKPRCSSPRMALRREEEETCETFTRKLEMTRSRTAARRSTSLKSVAEKEQPQKGADVGGNEEVAAPVETVKKEISALKKGMSTKCCRGPTRRWETMEKAESTIKPPIEAKTAVMSRKESSELKTGVFSTTCCRGQTRRCDTNRTERSALESKKPEAAQRAVTMKKEACITKCNLGQTQTCEMTDMLDTAVNKTFHGAPLSQQSSRAACKRGRCGALKLDIPPRCGTYDQLNTKYRRPHCTMCSQLGCLRNLEVICYCDACQEFRGGECSSPRMADFRKSHPGYVSQAGRHIHTI